MEHCIRSMRASSKRFCPVRLKDGREGMGTAGAKPLWGLWVKTDCCQGPDPSSPSPGKHHEKVLAAGFTELVLSAWSVAFRVPFRVPSGMKKSSSGLIRHMSDSQNI